MSSDRAGHVGILATTRGALRRVARLVPAKSLAVTALLVAVPLLPGVAGAGTATGSTVLVSNYDGTLSLINTGTNAPGAPITVPGGYSNGGTWVAVTPDGKTAYYANSDARTVTPINLATHALGTAITLPTNDYPSSIAISPNGQTVYVGTLNPRLIPISTATNQMGTPISLPAACVTPAVAITPDGRSAYVACGNSPGTVLPVNLTTAPPTVGTAITVGSTPSGIAITPGTRIAVGTDSYFVAITPNGQTAYVTNTISQTVTPITVATNVAGSPIPISTGFNDPYGVAVTPDGKTVYVAIDENSTVVPITTAGNTVGATIDISNGGTPYANAVVVTPDQAPTASFTVSPGAPGSPTSFNGTGSTAPVGTITTYAWQFGDGTQAVTSTPTTTHTYGSAGSYTATLTVTDSAGTSTTQTFTGQTVSNNGGPSAQSSRTVTVTSPTLTNPGYWTVAGDGGVFSFATPFYGSTGNLKLNQPVFAITSSADGKGYWFVARDGGVFTYGDAGFHGSLPSLGIPVTDIVGMAADTATGGYWLVGADGSVYSFGAPFHGSLPGSGVHVGNIVGIEATADGGGYYLVASSGAVYAYGDAKYQGGANTQVHLSAPIVGIGVDSATGGYWEAGSDGSVYAYGAPFLGSGNGTALTGAVVGIAATPDGSGYYLASAGGGVYAYNAPFAGSMGGRNLNSPMVGIAVAG